MHKSKGRSAGAIEFTDCISVGKDLIPYECPGYDTKQSDGEAQVMLELWVMQNSNLQSSLLRCGKRPNEWGAQSDSNSHI